MIGQGGENTFHNILNVFKVSLNRDQHKVLTDLMPRGFSLQPFRANRVMEEESVAGDNQKNKSKQKQQDSKSSRDNKDPDYKGSHNHQMLQRQSSQPQQPMVKVESTPSLAITPPVPQHLMECYLILKKLKKSFYAWPFKTPVDPKALGIPDYLNIINEPMDLKTIEDSIKNGTYSHSSEFHRDIYKMLMNSYKFNQKNSDVFATTGDFEEDYLNLCKEAKQGKLFAEKKVKEEVIKSQKGQNEEQMPFMPVKVQSDIKIKRKYTKRADREDKGNAQWLAKPEKIAKIDKKDGDFVPEKDSIARNLKESRRKDTVKQEDAFENSSRMQSQDYEAQLERSLSIQAGNEEDKDGEQAEFSEFEPKPSFSRQESRKQKVVHQKKTAGQKEKDRDSLKEMSEMKEVLVENERQKVVTDIQRKLTELMKEFNSYQLPKNKAKPTTVGQDHPKHPNFNNLSAINITEKKKIIERINQLPKRDLKYVIDICCKRRTKAVEEEGEFDIDLDKLDPKTLKELNSFLWLRNKEVPVKPQKKPTKGSNDRDYEPKHDDDDYGEEEYAVRMEDFSMEAEPELHHVSQREMGTYYQEPVMEAVESPPEEQNIGFQDLVLGLDPDNRDEDPDYHF